MKQYLKSIIIDDNNGMSDREKKTLTTLQKWIRYNKFPNKLVIHCLLLTCLWIFVCILYIYMRYE